MPTANVTEADTPEKFLKALEDFEDITYKNINYLIKVISSQLFEDVIKDTPVLTGRAKNNWVFSVGTSPTYGNVAAVKKKGEETASFDKSGKDAIAKMENGLRRAPSMIKKKTGVLEYYLTNSVPYIRKLEFGGYNPGPNTVGGYSSQAVGGMARKNVQKYSKERFSKISKDRGKL